jgi:acyl-ACP thioesterase
MFECTLKILYQGILPDLRVSLPELMKYVVEASMLPIINEAGDTLALANSGWIYLDLATRKPARVSEAHGAAYGPLAAPGLPVDMRVPDTSAYSPVGATVFTVPPSAMDSNGHVNNCRYR